MRGEEQACLNRAAAGMLKGGSGSTSLFTDTDMCAVREIFEDENTFRLLVNSLCPTIFGHELVKAGLVLCLVCRAL